MSHRGFLDRRALALGLDVRRGGVLSGSYEGTADDGMIVNCDAKSGERFLQLLCRQHVDRQRRGAAGWMIEREDDGADDQLERAALDLTRIGRPVGSKGHLRSTVPVPMTTSANSPFCCYYKP